MSASEQAEQLKAHGNELFQAGKYKDAVKKYEGACELCPSVPAYWSNAAACYAKMEKFRKMKEAAQHCIEVDDTFVKGYYRLAVAQKELGEFMEALETVNKGLELAPDNNDLRLLKVQVEGCFIQLPPSWFDQLDLETRNMALGWRRSYQQGNPQTPVDPDRLHPEMGKHFFEAVGEMGPGRNDYRRCADSFLAAVQASPSPWAYGCYNCFRNYGKVLARHKIANRSDKKVFQNFLNSPEAPVLFRTAAAYSLQLLFATPDDRDLKAEYCRQALAVATLADPQELSRPLETNTNPNSTVGAEITGIVDECQKILHTCENLLCQDALVGLAEVTGTDINYAKEYMSKRCPPELRSHYGVGGRACDCCGKTLEELGVMKLDCCTRCKRAYYCSKECQRKQWKAGHKAACREPGEIRQGDYMRITTLVPELHDVVVLVKERDHTKEGCWIVEVLDSHRREISIEDEKLVHLRPAK